MVANFLGALGIGLFQTVKSGIESAQAGFKQQVEKINDGINGYNSVTVTAIALAILGCISNPLFLIGAVVGLLGRMQIEDNINEKVRELENQLKTLVWVVSLGKDVKIQLEKPPCLGLFKRAVVIDESIIYS